MSLIAAVRTIAATTAVAGITTDDLLIADPERPTVGKAGDHGC